MYSKRIKIFVILTAGLLGICLLRLGQMQLLSSSFYRDRISELKQRRARSRQLKTIRGKILDRNGVVLATDEPRFELSVSYKLSSLLDGRVRQRAKEAEALADRLDDLRQITDKSARFQRVDPCDIQNQMRRMNDFVWNRRVFQAWRTNFPDSKLIRSHASVISIPLSKAESDFRTRVPDPVERRRLINKVNIQEMHESWPVVQLETDDDIFTAQLEFLDFDDVAIVPRGRRAYSYATVAPQTIGWVGRPQEKDKELFADDTLASYLEDEVCGREDGVEYVCETILRGRRGRQVYDIDRELVAEVATRFGEDVTLSLDIELQQRIEQYISDCRLNPNNCQAPTAAVVIDVASGEILALVSVPVFDLTRIGRDYGEIEADPDEPLRNRAINKQYPPGSVIKPIILVAGLESGKVTAETVISCPAQKAAKHWPSCWLFNRYGVGHDGKWSNIARNAIRGSCNIYFSVLADKIGSRNLQQWLVAFGYGRKPPLAPPAARENEHRRDFRQAPGIISSRTPRTNAVFDLDKFPISKGELRYFGIGQGNLRVTPLQVANAMATLARGGIYKLPRLFMPEPNEPEPDAVDLNISYKTLAVVYDGMRAVVSESSGTAWREFEHSGLDEQDVTVYGKTGSTENPDNAWFGGFAKDSNGRGISIAVVVEGGQHGSSDAAPLARDIIQFCIDAGYIGQGPG